MVQWGEGQSHLFVNPWHLKAFRCPVASTAVMGGCREPSLVDRADAAYCRPLLPLPREAELFPGEQISSTKGGERLIAIIKY